MTQELKRSLRLLDGRAMVGWIIGKVTFRADADLLGGRDALPGDNTAIGDPTKVIR